MLISHIRYGNILVRDSPNHTPDHDGAAANGEGMGVGVGWERLEAALMGIYCDVASRILDIYLCIHVYIYICVNT